VVEVYQLAQSDPRIHPTKGAAHKRTWMVDERPQKKHGVVLWEIDTEQSKDLLHRLIHDPDRTKWLPHNRGQRRLLPADVQRVEGLQPDLKREEWVEIVKNNNHLWDCEHMQARWRGGWGAGCRASLLDRSVENVIGHGMKLQAMTDDDGFNEAVETLWEDWWCGGKADIRGMSTGAQLESLWYRTHLCDGDLGIGLVDQGDNGAFVQTITGEYIDTLTGGYDAKTRTFEGIQFNQFGRPVAFNVLTEDPATLARSSKPVDARDFIFYPRLKHTNQLRGEPAFATTFDLFDQTYGIIDASTIAVRIAACQAMIVKKGAAGTALTNLPTVTNSQGAAQKALTIEPGMVHYLQPGEDIASFNPSQPQQNLPEFLRLLFRTVGIAVGLPLEILMLDFSQSNYSNARAALLQLQRACRPQQRLFCKRVMSRIYQWRVSKWVKDGELKVPAHHRHLLDAQLPCRRGGRGSTRRRTGGQHDEARRRAHDQGADLRGAGRGVRRHPRRPRPRRSRTTKRPASPKCAAI
jgi:lambda family phage portal protein